MRFVAILSLLLIAAAAPAPQAVPPTTVPQPAPAAPSPAFVARAGELIAVLNGGGTLATTFSPEFLAAIPEAQFRASIAQLTASYGRALAVAGMQPAGGPGQGIVTVRFERGEVKLGMAVAAAAPNLVTGLRVPVGWNNPAAAVDQIRLIGLVSRSAEQAAQ